MSRDSTVENEEDQDRILMMADTTGGEEGLTPEKWTTSNREKIEFEIKSTNNDIYKM